MSVAQPLTVATSTILDVRDLHKTFGEREVVRGVSFHINAGEIFGLLGPNGAGKSTTINMLATYLKPTSGTATVAGIPITEGERVKREIGLVPQEIALYNDLSAEENMRFFGEVYGIRGAALSARIDELLERVGLADRRKEKVDTFSGGMQRRLNLAAGLIHEPPLLMLDEPTVGVDPQTREAIFELAEQLRDSGVGILYTTHYMEEAERLCDRIAIIDEGHIVATGTLDELLAHRTAEPVVHVERPHGLAEVFLQLTGKQYRD
ncbi:MAG TPA: ABC transporter ATP-binding protein [Nitrolancea sp.]|jgi:ABC-2 type transport system ATP-binding protein|nr:ABC transporter ATP-binding protein [Nitrolancea sp.]